MDKLKIFDTGDNLELSTKVCELLGLQLGDAKKYYYSDGSPSWKINESVRGNDVFVFLGYSNQRDHGNRLHELYLLMNSLKSGACQRLTIVMPFAFGSRSEKRLYSKEPIESVVIAKNLKANGADGLLTENIHARTIGSVYDALDMQFYNLEFEPIIAGYFASVAKTNPGHQFVLNSPDAGGMSRVRYVGELMRENLGFEVDLSACDKYHKPGQNQVKVWRVIGDVAGKVVGIVDDMGDTLGTMIEAAETLKKNGAVAVYAAFPHAVFSGNAKERIASALREKILDGVLISDSIPCGFAGADSGIRVISSAPLLAKAIREIHCNGSVSQLHDYKKVMELYPDLEF